MKIHLRSLLLGLILVLMLTHPACAQNDTKISCDYGQTESEIQVSVRIAGNPGFSYCKTVLTYDRMVLRLKHLEGELINGAIVNLDRGVISFASASDVHEDGVLLIATFDVIEKNTEESLIAFVVDMQSANGAIVFDGKSISCKVEIERPMIPLFFIITIIIIAIMIVFGTITTLIVLKRKKRSS